jgi:hypothetical protein
MSDVSGTDIATLGMAAFTAWLAWETRRMASAAAQSNTLAEIPFFSISQFDLHQGRLVDTNEVPQPVVAQVVLTLKNPGRVRISYDFEQADHVVPNSPGVAGTWDNHIGILHPDEVAQFYLPAVRLARPFQVGDTSTLTLRVRYWSSEETRHTLTVSVRIGVVTLDPLKCRWSYTNGPSYA